MDFLENVKAVVSEAAQAVVKKSGELYDASKVQYLIFELKNDIKKLYSEIGKLTYLAVEKGEDQAEAVKMKCDIVAAKLAKIDALKNGAVEEESAFVCPVCNKEIDANSSFCQYCGTNMVEDAEAQVVVEDTTEE